MSVEKKNMFVGRELFFRVSKAPSLNLMNNNSDDDDQNVEDEGKDLCEW